MNPTAMLRFSLAANLGLVAAVALLIAQREPRRDRWPAEMRTAESLRPTSRVLSVPTTAAPTAVTPPAFQADRQRPFDWSWFDQTQWETYIAQLREVQCPFPTLCDIVLGGIHRQFGPRIQAARSDATPFWKTSRRQSPADLEERRQREAAAVALERERDELARRLLGVDFRSWLDGFSRRSESWGGLVSRVPDPERRSQVAEILTRFDDRERDLFDAAGGTLSLADETARKRLFRDRVRELKDKIPAAELENYQMRASPVAEELRSRLLVGFEPSETEFRALFGIYNDADELVNEAPETAVEMHRSAAAIRDRENRIREVLGEKRFADFLRSQDMTFQRIIETTDYLHLPNEAAIAVYETREQMLVQLRQVEAMADLSPEQRASWLGAIRNEVNEKVLAALGPSGFRRYSEAPWGQWIRVLGP